MAEKQVKTTIAKGTVTEQQASALDSLIGTIGSNRQDVVGKIITMWLYNDGIIKEISKSPPKRK